MEGTDLGGDDHLVANSLRLHPLTDELLGGFVLVIVGGVDSAAVL